MILEALWGGFKAGKTFYELSNMFLIGLRKRKSVKNAENATPQ